MWCVDCGEKLIPVSVSDNKTEMMAYCPKCGQMYNVLLIQTNMKYINITKKKEDEKYVPKSKVIVEKSNNKPSPFPPTCKYCGKDMEYDHEINMYVCYDCARTNRVYQRELFRDIALKYKNFLGRYGNMTVMAKRIQHIFKLPFEKVYDRLRYAYTTLK